MRASEFFEKHGVSATGLPIAEYPDEWGHTRQVWGLVLVLGHDRQRALRLTTETGRVDALDWNELLPSIVSDAQRGLMSFSEFVAEGFGEQPPLAVEQHRLWVGDVYLRGQIEHWLGNDTEMREDFYSITDDEALA